MSSDPEVVPATTADVTGIMGWLEREYEEDGKGFWSNRRVIADALDYDDVWVIRRNGEAVAFQVGRHSPSIVNVRKDWRRKGLGDTLFAASLERAHVDDVNLLSIECSPRSSWTYWRRLGFERYGDMSEWGTLTARRVLGRRVELPPDRPQARAVISFYPEAATYQRDVPPIIEHTVIGACRDDGSIVLERRVIGLSDDEPTGRDIAVKIAVEGEERCFSKAKHDAAVQAGVRHDRHGGTYYVDRIEARQDGTG